MKNYRIHRAKAIVRTVVFFFTWAVLQTSALKAEKYALIIAVGDYPQAGQWMDISSKNDIEHVNNALLVIGFSPNNITTITDADATKKGILVRFEELTKKLKKGDIVYIHFSGHGQQVMDDNNDEIDGLDEAIVPYDSPMRFQKGVYEGENLIRDDLIGQLTEAMRMRCGKDGQVILVLDSCHSGTGVRGMGKTRGTNLVMAPDDFVPNPNITEQKMKISGANRDNMAPMASFFGASAKELNYETMDDQSRPVGSLSYAISGVLANMKPGYTFEDFFDKVRLKMKVFAPRQNPQWEGPENIALFSGEVRKDVGGFKVEEVVNDQTLRVSFGTLTDVYKGTKVEVFSRETNKVIARGEVADAFLSHSFVGLDPGAKAPANELLGVRILSKAQPAMQIGLYIKLTDNSRWKAICNRLLEAPFVKPAVANADLYIVDCAEDQSLQLATRDGTILFEKSYSADQVERDQKNIENHIRAFAQGKFLRAYDNPDSDFDFSIEIIDVDCRTKKDRGLLGGDNLELKVGSCVKFKITNRGMKAGYFSLIDIQPDNVLNVVIPFVDLGYTAEEFFLKSGESYTTDFDITIGEPMGDETMKLIVSKTPQDLSGIVRTQGRSSRGVQQMDSFEQFLSATYTPTQTRGTVLSRPKAEEVGTSTLYFKIK